MILILAIFLTAVYNAVGAALKWNIKWTVPLYWVWVACYWMMRTAEVAY